MNDVTEIKIVLTVDEMRNIFGRNDSYMKKIEDNLGVEITDRGGQIHIVGRQKDAQSAADIIRQLAKLSSAGSRNDRMCKWQRQS